MASNRTVVFLLFIYVFVLRPAVSENESGCDINLNKDLPPSNQPIILKKSNKQYELLIPKVKSRQGIIELKKGEEVVLACPGPKNYLQQTRKDTAATSCVEGTNLAAGTTIVDTRKAQCAEPVTADIAGTRKKCSGQANIYEVGFRVNVSQSEGWHPMFDVCHDTSLSNTLYSKHTVIGSALRGAERESNRPKFSKGSLNELYKGFNPEYYYTKMLGKYFNDEDKFLSRGHLAPDADFLFGSWQYSTYFFVNVAPQWQSINGKNWLTVEKLVREKATKLKDDLLVVTGTHGILELRDSKNRSQKMYLNNKDKKLPVPEYFWKVVQHPKTKQGIAFLTSNNPFRSVASPKPLCTDICKSSNWTKKNTSEEFIQPEQGLTICCAVNDLRKEISHVPSLDIGSVLNF